MSVDFVRMRVIEGTIAIFRSYDYYRCSTYKSNIKIKIMVQNQINQKIILKNVCRNRMRIKSEFNHIK